MQDLILQFVSRRETVIVRNIINTKIKTIGINTSNIPLDRFEDNELDVDEDGFLYSNLPGKKITLSASVIDDFYVCYDNESELIKTDKTSETIKLEMKHVETNGDFSRYNLVEDTSLKTESKHSNVSMLLHTNKQQVLECRYIISK